MDPHKAPSDAGFEQAIADYASLLNAIEQATPSPSFEQMLEVLVARDTVEALRLTTVSATGQSLAALVQLDRRLKAQAQAWIPIAQLGDCRQTMQPPESAWWWHLAPPPPPEPWLSRFDWFWNLLTVGCLVITGTFATSTARAFSTSGFDLLTTFIIHPFTFLHLKHTSLPSKTQTFYQTQLHPTKVPSLGHKFELGPITITSRRV